MLKILNNSLDGIVLGQKKADFDDVILNNPNYSLEFDRKHKTQSDSELITVSSLRNCDEFCLNGKVINFSNLEKFLEEMHTSKPIIDIYKKKSKTIDLLKIQKILIICSIKKKVKKKLQSNGEVNLIQPLIC